MISTGVSKLPFVAAVRKSGQAVHLDTDTMETLIYAQLVGGLIRTGSPEFWESLPLVRLILIILGEQIDCDVDLART